jgi:hypothetical protein
MPIGIVATDKHATASLVSVISAHEHLQSADIAADMSLTATGSYMRVVVLS